MSSQQDISTSGAIKASSAALVFGLTSNIAIIFFGIIISIIYRKGAPQQLDWLWILGGCAIAWAVIALQSLHTAARGISRSVPEPELQPLQHVVTPYTSPTGMAYHLVPVTGPVEPTLDGVPITDVLEFIEQLHVRGVTYDAWCRPQYDFKSGRKCNYETWQKLTEILRKGGVLIKRGHRRKSLLLTTDAEVIKNKLRIYQLLGQ